MTRPKVVVADKIAQSGLAMLQQACDVVECVGASREQLREALKDAQAIVVRSATQVDEELIESAPLLEVIGRAGAGVDNIDLGAAARAEVVVVNAPDASTISAAEHTLALLLASARRVPEADASLRGGAWNRSTLTGVELHEKTLGVIGLGRIGGQVARLASAFGMNVLAHDPYVTLEKAEADGTNLVDLDTLYRQSDFITIHLPLTPATEGMIGKEQLAAMKQGVRLVNVARGGLIDEDELAKAIRSGHVAGAALDVYAEEPATGSPLLELDQVVATPHLGASTAEAQDRTATDTARAVLHVLIPEAEPTAS